MLSYVAREPESEGGHCETALVILVVEPAEEKTLETAKKKYFAELVLSLPGFEPLLPLLSRATTIMRRF